ncbi:hypothetical protein Dimus_002384 [Dionaea muscipula]
MAAMSLKLIFLNGLPSPFPGLLPKKMAPTNQSPLSRKQSPPLVTNAAFSLHRVAPPRLESARCVVGDFDPSIPIEDAVTPPSSWYTDPSFYALELDRVFYRGWQAVGYSDQVKEVHAYFTGRLGSVEYVVCRDGYGKLHAFHNVCRHHASILAYGSGQKSCFVCPYHHGEIYGNQTRSLHASFPSVYCIDFKGWTYGLDGALLRATRITEPQKFDGLEFGLVSVDVGIWGPFVVINLDKRDWPKVEADDNIVGHDWLGSCSDMLSFGGVDSSLSYVCRREYTIDCNWKVFCDNYLDGGYHVPYAHRGLASGLELNTYTTDIFEKVSIQRCYCGSTETAGDFDRLGSEALYAFVYPNFMINRYGPWMDTNLVLPLGPRKCQVVFDYFLDASLKVKFFQTQVNPTAAVYKRFALGFPAVI